METIREARTRLGLTTTKIKKTLGIPLRTQQSWEHEERKPSPWLEAMVVREYERIANETKEEAKMEKETYKIVETTAVINAEHAKGLASKGYGLVDILWCENTIEWTPVIERTRNTAYDPYEEPGRGTTEKELIYDNADDAAWWGLRPRLNTIGGYRDSHGVAVIEMHVYGVAKITVDDAGYENREIVRYAYWDEPSDRIVDSAPEIAELAYAGRRPDERLYTTTTLVAQVTAADVLKDLAAGKSLTEITREHASLPAGGDVEYPSLDAALKALSDQRSTVEAWSGGALFGAEITLRLRYARTYEVAGEYRDPVDGSEKDLRCAAWEVRPEVAEQYPEVAAAIEASK